MKNGAVRSDDCNARVVDLEDLKMARERRASSSRHGSDELRAEILRRAERPDPDDRKEPKPQGKSQGQKVRRLSRSSVQKRTNNSSLMLLFLLLALLTLAVVIGLNIFRVTSFDVTGNGTVTAESIITLSGIAPGENIFKANLTQAKKYIEADPLLQVQSITRVFPDTIKIDVRQRIPHGVIVYLGSYVIIDENGIVLDIRDALPSGQYPLITGIEIEPAEKGKRLGGVDDRILQVLYDLLSCLYDKGAMPFISEAVIDLDGDILLLTAEGLKIDMGNPTNLDVKSGWIACTVPELRTKGYTSGVLYITGANNPVYSPTGASGTGDTEQGETGENADEAPDGEGDGDQGEGEGDPEEGDTGEGDSDNAG